MGEGEEEVDDIIKDGEEIVLDQSDSIENEDMVVENQENNKENNSKSLEHLNVVKTDQNCCHSLQHITKQEEGLVVGVQGIE